MIGAFTILLTITLFILSFSIIAPKYSYRVNQFYNHIALRLFGNYVTNKEDKINKQKRILQRAHIGTTQRVYASKALLYATIFSGVGSVLGLYVMSALLGTFTIPESVLSQSVPSQLQFLTGITALNEIGVLQLFGLFLVSNITIGLFFAYASYQLFWWLPEQLSNHRAQKIDESLPRLVAFTYAMSRSGMGFHEIMETVARNKQIYGEAASEVEVGVHQISLYGVDVITAVREVSSRSPSTQFAEFFNNLGSVLQSGQKLPTFLETQYNRYKEQQESRQEYFIDRIATLAEVYVSAFVVGSLLLITVLVVVGAFGIGDTVFPLRVITYGIIPILTLAFLYYLGEITETPGDLNAIQRPITSIMGMDADSIRTRKDDDSSLSNKEQQANNDRYEANKTLKEYQRYISRPIERIRSKPSIILYVTIPIVVLITAVRLWMVSQSGTLTIPAVDDILVQSALFITITLTGAYEYHAHYKQSIEKAIPDFLERLASVNEAGMSIVDGLKRTSSTADLGNLNDELERMHTDIQLGADIETAMYRLNNRVNTPSMARVVTLITNAMRASGNIGQVLRIAANDAQNTRRLREERKEEMRTYLVIIYLSFLVFLVIIAAITEVLIPSVPVESIAQTQGASQSGISLTAGKQATYTLLLYHTALIQSFLSGFVAGVMGENEFMAGAKHATVLLLITYGVFLLL